MVANRDGGVENLEVKGDLLLRIAEPDRGLIRVRLGNVNNKQFQFKVRPALASRTHQTRGSIQARPGVARARCRPTRTSTGICSCPTTSSGSRTRRGRSRSGSRSAS